MPWWLLLALPWVVSGSTSTDAKLQARAVLQGTKVRVTFGAQEDPYIFKDDLERHTGVLPDFLEQLRREVGFVTEIVDVSNDSVAVVGTNRNTACARDVQMNRTDLCVGNSWVTTQRLGYAKVLPTLWQESLELVTRETIDTSFSNALLSAFKPFDQYLWLAIGIVIMLYSILAWFAEHKYNNRDFPDKNIVSSGLTSLYHGLFGFFWSEPPTRPVTAEGRVLLVGFGFFTLIMLSSYTASLASVLVSDDKTPEFQTLQEAIDSGARVCMWDSVLARASRLYPGLVPLHVNMDSNKDGFRMMNQGACQAILCDAIFHAKQQEETTENCDKVLKGGPILDINCAWPVADWLVGPMSMFITELVDKGVLDELKQTYSPRVVCETTVEEEGLQIQNVSGVFFIIGAFLVAAGIVHMCKRGVRQSKKSGSLQRMSTSIMRKRTTTTSATSTTSTDSSGKEVAAAANGQAKRTSVESRVSGRGSDGSLQSIDPGDPGHAMVLAFREEKRLREMPFEKALLVIGNAQAKADEELIAALREMKAQRGEDLESTDSLTEAPAAKLHESKALKHPDSQWGASRV